jgi:hypothetical protein
MLLCDIITIIGEARLTEVTLRLCRNPHSEQCLCSGIESPTANGVIIREHEPSFS